jgi:hypothetical protein
MPCVDYINYQPYLATLLSGESPVEQMPSTGWKVLRHWQK